jgi:hypothetical protein
MCRIVAPLKIYQELIVTLLTNMFHVIHRVILMEMEIKRNALTLRRWPNWVGMPVIRTGLLPSNQV